MDIHQIKYLITIVNNGFNLTKSAKALGVSQPALSKLINELETSEKVQIFTRGKGRITGLTPLGDDLIIHGRQVSADFDEMINSLRDQSNLNRGTVRIGIPPIISATIFDHALPDFIDENPDINLQIVEQGGYELQRLLLHEEIDLAVIPSPITNPAIHNHVIYKNSVAVWFNKDHRFNKSTQPITLSEISKEHILTLSNNFMIAHELHDAFINLGINKEFYFQSSAWDLILNMCQDMKNTVGIVASPVAENYSGNIVHRNLDPVRPWIINICNLQNTYSSNLVKYTNKWFSDYFDHVQAKGVS